MEQRVIFDTSIFGLLIKEKNIENIQIEIKEDTAFKVLGINAIRREIKNVEWSPTEIKSSILKLYEFLIEKEYAIDKKIEEFAEKYYNYYKESGGKKLYKELRTDLLIVATATVKNVDILVSIDRETMSMSSKYGEIFRKTYHHINVGEGFRDPNFWQYKDLKLKFKFFTKRP
ncbi:hypothetical protein HYT56_02255 [Candidatus Woesearchaeota archaeon]|nr:hypothetical protein [Candidatus Woesearchaeota archaeon]